MTSTPLPPLYAEWMEELFKGPLPDEPHATCSDCAMCSKSAEPPEPHGRFFSPSTKCCTYLPILPNFLVGRMLRDEDPAAVVGRKSVLDRIARRVAVSPLGLGQPRPFATLYQHGRVSFGHGEAFLCPHYIDEQGGLCGIWKHREAVCATWFCKHDRGAVGKRFWMALRDLLVTVERHLSLDCALELEVGDTALGGLFEANAPAAGQKFKPGEIDGYVRKADYSRKWGPWEGRESEFYQHCAAKVDGMSWKRALSLCGPQARALLKIAESAYRDLCSTEVAEQLRMGSFRVISGGETQTLVETYSTHNPLKLPTALLALLPHFDGRPTHEVLSELEKVGFQLEDKLVRKLMDYKLLVPANKAALTADWSAQPANAEPSADSE